VAVELPRETLDINVGNRLKLLLGKPLNVLTVCIILLTNCSHFYAVLNALINLYTEVVKPASSEISPAIQSNPRRWPYFKDCVGALDSSHFYLHVPVSEQRRFRNRHGDLTHNVLSVVDFNINFTYILAGWEGSAHDGRVLNDAISRGFRAPEGRYFLADAGYANRDFLLSPYRGVRYHLREIRQVDRAPKDKWELFNYRHSSLRNVVERTFGVFKRRWRIFDRPHEFSIGAQVKLVYALAAVHNYINTFYPVEDDNRSFEQLGEQELAVPKEEPVDELAESDTNMNRKRDEIAGAMWEKYCEQVDR
jgi:hypothetical protein